MKSTVMGSLIGGGVVIVILIVVGALYLQNNESSETDPSGTSGTTQEMPPVADPSNGQEPTPPAPPAEDEDVRRISFAEVEQNDTPESCWTIVEGRVYDLTSFIARHPGGSGAISSICGRDGTTEFQGQASHGTSADQQLESLYLGIIE